MPGVRRRKEAVEHPSRRHAAERFSAYKPKSISVACWYACEYICRALVRAQANIVMRRVHNWGEVPDRSNITKISSADHRCRLERG